MLNLLAQPRDSVARAKRHPSLKILAWVKVNAAYVISLHVEIYSLRMIAQVQHHSHGSNISNICFWIGLKIQTYIHVDLYIISEYSNHPNALA